MEIQKGQRFVLDGNSGVTNFMSEEPLQKHISDSLERFISQLRYVCGPFSRYSLLLMIDTKRSQDAHGSEYDSRAFIKDGRYLITYSEYISPIENYIKSMILYIGTHIDNICHDGTTTAMLFACRLLQQMLNYRKLLKENKNDVLSKSTTFQIEKVFTEVFDKVKEEMKKEVINLEYLETLGYTRSQAASMIAYLQSYTSSGGDKDISKELSKFFTYMPECAWDDTITNRIPAIENKDKRIEAVVSDYEIEVPTQCMTYLKNNYDNDNYYRNEDVDLLVIPQPLPDNDIATINLYQFLDETEFTKPLVIMVPNCYMGNSVISNIQTKGINKKAEFIILSYNYTRTNTPIIWDIDSIPAKANKPKFMIQEGIDIPNCIIHNVVVTISNKWTRFDNITPKDDRDYPKNTHPGLTYPDDYLHYTRFKIKLDKEIDLLTKFHRKDLTVISQLKKANTLIQVIYPLTIKLGGLSHEMQAMIPVLEDCSGASMASVTHGFLLNGIYRLAKVCKKLAFDHLDISEDNYINIKSIEDYVYVVLYKTSELVSYDTLGPLTDTNIKINYDDLMLPVFYLDLLNDDISTIEDVNDYFNDLSNHNFEDTSITKMAPMQPANFIDELLDRCRELLVKLSITSSMVVPGSAWLDTKKDN